MIKKLTEKPEIKLYFCNGHAHTIHLEQESQINELIQLKHKLKVEELLEGITYLQAAPYTLPDPNTAKALQLITNNPEIAPHTQLRQYTRLEPLPYETNRGYGGIFLSWQDGGASSYIIGDPTKVLPVCKTVYDIEEYLRLSIKWQQTNYSTMLLASRDDEDSHRNTLIRGLKNSLNIIALIGVG